VIEEVEVLTSSAPAAEHEQREPETAAEQIEDRQGDRALIDARARGFASSQLRRAYRSRPFSRLADAAPEREAPPR